MTLISYLLLFATGYLLVNAVSPKFDSLFKIGAAFPLGFGLVTLLMFVLSFIGVTFNLMLLLGLQSVMAFLIYFGAQRHQLFEGLWDFSDLDFHKWKDINIAMLLLLGILVFVLYGITVKGIFWPTVAYDSVTGYDLLAKVVAGEGSFNNSIFDPSENLLTIRHRYPPLVPGSFAFAYLAGLSTPKWSVITLFLSTPFMLFGLMRYVSNTLAMLFTVLAIIVPEYLAMAALSLTNVPQSLYAGFGMILLFLYIRDRHKYYFILGSIFIGLNVWTRLDGVVFVLGGGFMLFLDALIKGEIKSKRVWLDMIQFGGIAIAPLILWQLFAKLIIDIPSSDGVFVTSLFWDADKFSQVFSLAKGVVTSTQYYGAFFLIFVVVTLLNLFFFRRDKWILLSGLVFTFFVYFMLYYQMDNGGDKFGYSIESMINSSYKRGMFPFIPIMAYYAGTSEVLQKTFKRLYKPFI